MENKTNKTALFPFGKKQHVEKVAEKPKVETSRKPHMKTGWVYVSDDLKKHFPKGWDQDDISTQISILWAMYNDRLKKRMNLINLLDSTLVQRIQLLQFINQILGLDTPPDEEKGKE